MQTDTYTPGYGAAIVNFMAQRTAETHAGFFLPQLKPGWSLLDAGCGPGAITLGLARTVAPGQVIGIDVEDSQFGNAREQAQLEGLPVEFRKASVYHLPFPDGSFDAVFSHALLEHVSDPAAAVLELRRVLKPGGLIGLRAGDLGGLLIDSASEGPAQAFGAYLAIQKNGSRDPNVGRKLGRLLRNAGFAVQKVTASYEVITEALFKLGPALAREFAASGGFCSLQDRAPDNSLFVALAWCEATGRAN
ncbi:MAG: methyltransferase domain-containing protein [Bryobacteraceae bacterium]